jgi:hypothetical protein
MSFGRDVCRGIFSFSVSCETEDCTKFFQDYLWRKFKPFEIFTFFLKQLVFFGQIGISPKGFMFLVMFIQGVFFSMVILLLSHEF